MKSLAAVEKEKIKLEAILGPFPRDTQGEKTRVEGSTKAYLKIIYISDVNFNYCLIVCKYNCKKIKAC